jgi:hypothetical protein
MQCLNPDFLSALDPDAFEAIRRFPADVPPAASPATPKERGWPF